MSHPTTPEEDARVSWSLGILVGGRSRRMGHDKAFLELDGETLTARCARRCGAGAREILLAAGARGRVLPADVSGRPVFDARPDQGPLAGIAALLAAATTDAVVIVPCDMPEMDGSVLHPLLAALADGPDIDGAAFARGGRREPLPVALRPRAAATVDALLAGGRRRLVDLDERLAVARLDAEEHLGTPRGDRVFRNINTPGDYERLRRGEGGVEDIDTGRGGC